MKNNTLKTILFTSVIFSLSSLEAQANTTFPNPIKYGAGDPRLIIGTLIQVMIGVSGMIALIMFVYGGMLFLTAAGNEGQISKAKKVLLYSILGIIAIAAAFVATNTIIQAILTGSTLVPSGTN
jgi:hypothetical protein